MIFTLGLLIFLKKLISLVSTNKLVKNNYNSLPQELKLIFDYESVEMAIDDVVEVIAFRIIRRNEENEEKNNN